MAEEKKTAKKDTKKAEDTKTTKSDIEIKPGMTVRVHEIIREKNAKGEEKQRTQIFEGIILAKKHRKEIGATITVRKVSGGIGVEKIFPLNSPIVEKIEPIKQATVRRAKLGYLRTNKKRLKETKLT
ncbi:50S ribosomal protein L19 [Candidatus Parcubacteria bacterium]|jgi:large subunit ribosomal protein L19|nr:50S ribosomal protein L19 [Candidatus Parcubacteria bacterium]MBT7228211.1 50S ribosomal protein L19 [Candidatus Parcubacteria bacterium]